MPKPAKVHRPCTEPRPCRSCQAPVLWATTRSEKKMPVDAEPVPDGDLVLTLKGDKSELLVEKFYEPKHEPDRRRFTSHFSTCVNADQHRKPA